MAVVEAVVSFVSHSKLLQGKKNPGYLTAKEQGQC